MGMGEQEQEDHRTHDKPVILQLKTDLPNSFVGPGSTSSLCLCLWPSHGQAGMSMLSWKLSSASEQDSLQRTEENKLSVQVEERPEG